MLKISKLDKELDTHSKDGVAANVHSVSKEKKIFAQIKEMIGLSLVNIGEDSLQLFNNLLYGVFQYQKNYLITPHHL